MVQIENASAVVLAAGKGTRMGSEYPKVLVESEEGPILGLLLTELLTSNLKEIVIVTGFQNEVVETYVRNNFVMDRIKFVRQEEQRGTGDAFWLGLQNVSECEQVFCLLGDVPLVSVKSLCELARYAKTRQLSACFYSMLVYQKNEYGRVIRDFYSGNVLSIEEYKHTTSAQKLIREVSTGVFVFDYRDAKAAFEETFEFMLDQCRARKIEFYLPLILEVFAAKGMLFDALLSENSDEFIGVNKKDELEELNRALLRRRLTRLKEAGVRFHLLESVYIGPQVELASDVEVGINVLITGKCQVGRGSVIGPNVYIKDSSIGSEVEIRPFSVIEGSRISDRARVGPFARLRPGTELGEGVIVGNFVETKNAKLRDGVKANHLSYLGDCEVGPQTNIGAGVIFCNFDGFSKHQTRVGAECFIGSNVNLVAPLEIGDRVILGAGSTITKNVPSEALAVERADTRVIPGAYFRYVERKKG